MDLNTAKAALLRYGFDANDPTETWLEAAKIEVEDAYDWPWMQKLANVNINQGTQTVSALLPDDLFKMYSIRDTTNNNKLKELDMVGFEREIQDPSLTGKPKYYTINQQTPIDNQEQVGIQMYPIPDTAIVLRVIYQVFTPSIIGMGGASPLPGPSRLHYLYVLGAAYRGLMADNEEDRASVAQGQFDSDLRRAVGKFSSRVAESETVQNVMGY